MKRASRLPALAERAPSLLYLIIGINKQTNWYRGGDEIE